MLSAAALRRRLLERQASAPATPAREDNEETSRHNDNDERKRKKGPMSPLKTDSPRTAEEILLGTFGAATTEDDLYGTPDALQEPPSRKLLQLSSFKPNKDNIQTRPDGVAILRFSDAEVFSPCIMPEISHHPD